MDGIDSKIVARLQRNARESLSSLARALSLSRSTLKDRLDRLESKGIIQGYTVKLNPEYQGRRIRAQVLLTVEPQRYAEIVDELAQFDGIRTLQAVSGKYDLIAMLETENTEALDNLVDQIGAMAGVRSTQTLIIFSTKFQR